MNPPNLDELLEGIEDPRERDRLRRMHDLLVATGPPPELSPALVGAPDAPVAEDEEPDTAWMPPRRLGAALLIGAGLLGAAFGVGYIAGQDGSDSRPAAAPPEQPASVVALRPSDQNNTPARASASDASAPTETGRWWSPCGAWITSSAATTTRSC